MTPLLPPDMLSDHTVDVLYDVLRGVAAATESELVGRIAHTFARHARADLAVAFNHKQIASKLWLIAETSKLPPLKSIWIVGGWYGVLPALLYRHARFSQSFIRSLDIDPSCAEVARTLNAPQADAGQFEAATADMLTLDYRRDAPDLLINTACEHLGDVVGWLARLQRGQMVVLQSNDYAREPDHVSCVADLDAFKQQARLTTVTFEGALPTKNYTRFMLIGTV